MPRARSILSLCCAALAVAPFLWGADDLRLLFTGDILLSRQVRREIEQTGRFPWTPFESLFRSANWAVGNLEGAVGNAKDCLPADAAAPCFDIPSALIPLLSHAGFRAMGMANNHASDLGSAGSAATRQALRHAGLDALSFEESPAFVHLGDYTMAVIALSLVPGRDAARQAVPGIELRQKLRLARTLADMVVVYVHWGSELLDWPNRGQRDAAEWLVANGADLIVGHHPHVVQPVECLHGRPVFFSLGNHLFDQKYPAAKQGLIADCTIRAGVLQCGSIATTTPPGSAFPELADSSPAPAACLVELGPRTPIAGYALRGRVAETAAGRQIVIEGQRDGARTWRSQGLPLLSAEIGRFRGSAASDYLLTLEHHSSPIDNEDGVRPYVYEVGPRGLIARWRGSALAWPLLDAALLPSGDGVLCALHRRDSFLVLQPSSEGVRTAAYRWNGFGFSGLDDPAIVARCQALFDLGQ